MEEVVHTFYLRTAKQQKLFVWKVAAALLLFILGVLALTWVFSLYLLIMVIPVALLIMAPFIDVPGGVKSGQLIHYSPLFIASKERKGEVVVHGGTLFDYYFSLGSIARADRKRAILSSYLKGLVRLVEQYEEEGKRDLVIKGTSYIINARTAGKMGFKLVKTDLLQKMILILNYIPVLIAYSYAQGKLSFPDLSKVITFNATIEELSGHKETMARLAQRME